MLGVIIHMAFLETMLYPSLSNVGIITHLFFCFIGSTGLLTATSGSKKDPLFLFAFVFYGFGAFWLQIESAIGIKVDFFLKIK